MYMCTYVSMYLGICVSMYLCIYVSMYPCICACMCIIILLCYPRYKLLCNTHVYTHFTTTILEIQHILQRTIATHYCNTLLQHTTTSPYWNTVLQYFLERRSRRSSSYCNTLVRCTTTTHCCSTLLYSTTATHNCTTASHYCNTCQTDDLGDQAHTATPYCIIIVPSQYCITPLQRTAASQLRMNALKIHRILLVCCSSVLQ